MPMIEAPENRSTDEGAGGRAAPRTRVRPVVRAAGGAVLIVVVAVGWLRFHQPPPVEPMRGFLPIAFFAPAGQVSVASADVKEILFSFDGATWNRAADLDVSITDFEGAGYAAARVDPEDKDRHAKVFLKYVTTHGRESPVAEFGSAAGESIVGVEAGRNPQADERVAYANNFDVPLGSSFPEWSSSRITFSNRFGLPLAGTRDPQVVTNVESPKGKRRFLGEFGGPRLDPTARTRVKQTVRLALKKLAAHRRVTLRFDLLVLKSWDGSSPRYGPDRFCLMVKDGPVLLDTTFSNNPKLKEDQSFQDYPRAHGKAQTGAAAVRTLGYTFFGDSAYHLSFTFPHAADTLVLDFASDLFEGKGTEDESWGLDNVTVRLDDAPGS
jgi:hypothetical protein